MPAAGSTGEVALPGVVPAAGAALSGKPVASEGTRTLLPLQPPATAPEPADRGGASTDDVEEATEPVDKGPPPVGVIGTGAAESGDVGVAAVGGGPEAVVGPTAGGMKGCEAGREEATAVPALDSVGVVGGLGVTGVPGTEPRTC